MIQPKPCSNCSRLKYDSVNFGIKSPFPDYGECNGYWIRYVIYETGKILQAIKSPYSLCDDERYLKYAGRIK